MGCAAAVPSPRPVLNRNIPAFRKMPPPWGYRLRHRRFFAPSTIDSLSAYCFNLSQVDNMGKLLKIAPVRGSAGSGRGHLILTFRQGHTTRGKLHRGAGSRSERKDGIALRGATAVQPPT